MIVSPQWIQNTNTIIIILGGPLLVLLFSYLRKNNLALAIPVQFSVALGCIGVGFVLLPLGIYYADAQGYVAIHWVIASYIFQSIGELFISPIGYAMVGQLITGPLQGIYMGVWLMVSGLAGVISSALSNIAIAQASSIDPLTTNPGYSATFLKIGWGAILFAILFFLFSPRVKRLMSHTEST